MINIGLIGESPYDTTAIKHLLQQKYRDGFRYKILLRNITGDQLKTAKANRAAQDEITEHKPEIVIVIRDLDTHESNATEIAERYSWYNDIVKHNSGRSIFLLNIQELEALILADIKNTGDFYNLSMTYKGNVMAQTNPKEYLKSKTNKKYNVSHCPELFLKLDINTIAQNCRYFKIFIDEFESAIKN